ncbi:MAG TPA: RelA/SpoT family protein [Micromonosporaceae bacterium]|nr:RelA/SpoT family protein [Micromonosporaceae bacterium]
MSSDVAPGSGTGRWPDPTDAARPYASAAPTAIRDDPSATGSAAAMSAGVAADRGPVYRGTASVERRDVGADPGARRPSQPDRTGQSERTRRNEPGRHRAAKASEPPKEPRAKPERERSERKDRTRAERKAARSNADGASTNQRAAATRAARRAAKSTAADTAKPDTATSDTASADERRHAAASGRGASVNPPKSEDAAPVDGRAPDGHEGSGHARDGHGADGRAPDGWAADADGTAPESDERDLAAHHPDGDTDALVLPFPGGTADANGGLAVDGRDGVHPSNQSSAGTFLPVVPTGRRVRARLARFNAPWQSPQISEVLEPLIAQHRVSHPRADTRALQRSFEVADHWHSGQYRKSGDPYITHPLAVAGILANLGMDTTTLVAALLHDTIEDTSYTLDAMREDFGAEVALLVDGVTKLDRVKLGDAAKAETIRKMVVAMAKDPRVLVIKLADRLHNMRTLTFLPRPKQEQKAKETLEILAPLAHRLGMNTIKWELEDLAFNTLFPKKFEEIHRLIDEHSPQRDSLLRQVTQRVQTDLKGAKVKAEVTGRPKHLYSIYQKMISRSREFAEIYDLVGVRILVETTRDCYAALGVIHENWQPVPGRFKDYIAMPKFNMYQSLHTTVIGPTGKPVEMQIRTTAMDRTAEYGIAAHWRYKETKGATIVGPPAHIDEMTWLRQLLDWQREAADPSEFLDALRFDLSSQEVYVFTPKGDVIPLPSGSTPVDFAYAVHTEVGHRCIGARVNGKLVPLESTLSNGDVVEIFTSKSETAGPTQDWLGFVKSPRARTKIRQHFNKERRDEAIEAGKDAIAKAMRKQGLPLQRMLTTDTLMTIARDLHLADVSALYAAVGESQVSAQAVVTRLVAAYGGEEGAVEDIAESTIATRPPRSRGAAYDPGVVVVGVTDVWIKLARCCTPVPGDDVFGFVTRSGGVSVHREDCLNATDLLVQKERLVEVTWKATSASTFLVAIQVEALDRHKLLADVTRALSEEKVNILSATVTTTRDRVAVSRFSFEMADPKHLGHLLAAVRRVDGVYDAYRVTSGA